MTFNELNLSAPLLKAVSEAGYETPSPIQASAIPPVLEGRDLMGCAQTGTGKTAAFALPMLDRLSGAAPRKKGAIRALVLTPTRELALQIGESFAAYGKYLKLRSTVIFGGVGQTPQVEAIKKGVDILIACPGRLNDLIGQGYIDLANIEIFVLDEADRMLDMGFFKDVTRIIDKVKNRKNLGLFSATISQEVMTVSWMYQRDEVEITVEPKQEDRPDIDQFSITCTPLEKAETSLRLIRSQGYERVMIFCNTKHMCQRLCDEFQRAGLDCDCIHGDIRQSQREKTMQRYRDGKLAVLIATDVASRGIDVDDVDCVINYDVPEENEYYVHRIGRTGRAKKKGVAWSIVSNFPEKARLDDICKYCNFTIQPMVMDKDGNLTPEEVKAPVTPKRRFR
mgnify:CR=1 FL=1